MNYEDKDINFLKLTDNQFEEACFELLLRLGYKGLIWRTGGADSGRDIEGFQAVNNPLVGTYDEKWFFECKRYESGVPVEQLNSKIAWADAEKPKHLVFLVSSHLSNNSRAWLEKISQDKYYLVHLIEGFIPGISSVRSFAPRRFGNRLDDHGADIFCLADRN